MIRTKYPKAFDEFWDTFDKSYGSKGSKPRALAEFRRLKVDNGDLEMLMSKVIEQQFEKDQQRLNSINGFFEPFQHVERWLKNGRWEE